jgi:hypothetical protein
MVAQSFPRGRVGAVPCGLGVGHCQTVEPSQQAAVGRGPILGGRIQPRGASRFPLIPTDHSEVERKRPAVWLWTLLDLFVTVVVLMWLLATHR